MNNNRMACDPATGVELFLQQKLSDEDTDGIRVAPG